LSSNESDSRTPQDGDGYWWDRLQELFAEARLELGGAPALHLLLSLTLEELHRFDLLEPNFELYDSEGLCLGNIGRRCLEIGIAADTETPGSRRKPQDE
jgi:hypothetical protein